MQCALFSSYLRVERHSCPCLISYANKTADNATGRGSYETECTILPHSSSVASSVETLRCHTLLTYPQGLGGLEL